MPNTFVVKNKVAGNSHPSYNGDYNWNSAGNWSAGIPTAGAQVIFENATTAFTTLFDIANVTNVTLSLGNNITLVIAAGDTLGVQNINSFSSSAVIQIDGSATFGSALAGTYIVSGTASFDALNNGPGTFDIFGGSVSFSAAAQLNNLPTSFNFEGVKGGKVTVGSVNSTLNGWVYGVTNFALNDTITLATNMFVAGSTAVYNASAHTLSVMKTGGGVFVFNNFSESGTAGSNFLVTANSIENVCFASGTRLLTSLGEVAVDDLAEGDLVVTVMDGGTTTRPVRWVGRKPVDLLGHPNARKAAPVRIRAGAMAPGMPHRDLVVSPDHCLFLDGVLVPAKLLVNGGSILQDMSVESVVYFHIELDRHAVVLAEGLPSESYLDTGNRAWFADASLHPEFGVDPAAATWADHACARLAVDAATVQPIWARLADRSDAMGHGRAIPVAMTDAAVRLTVGDLAIRPVGIGTERVAFAVPANTATVRLMSRASAPGALRPWLDDRRTLGLAVAEIVLCGTEARETMTMNDPALGAGWHPYVAGADHGRRWTAGDASIALPAWVTSIEVSFTCQPEYALSSEWTERRLAA